MRTSGSFEAVVNFTDEGKMGICDGCDGLIRDTRAGEIKIRVESCVDGLEIDVNFCGECREKLLKFLRGCNCPDLKWVPRDIEW